MASLSAHLRQTGDHGRLGFRADCPVCREARLLGSLSSESAISRRAQAALATGALAVSMAAPSPVWGQEPDSRNEGTAAPQSPSDGLHGGAPDEPGAPGFDPGGDTSLPFDVGSPGKAPQDGADDEGPLEPEPSVDPDVRLVPPNESEPTPPSAGDERPVAPVPPAPASPPTVPPPPSVAAPQEPERAGPISGNRSTANERAARIGAAREADKQEHQPARQPSAPPAPPQTAQVVAQAAPAIEIEPAAERDVQSPHSRYRVVRPGESLWSIARDLLGRGASMGQVAREVNRLWEMNEDRIATGDPDLLRIGTKLRLR